MVAKKINISCPNCEEPVKVFTAIALTEDFKILLWGECCGYELASPPMDILAHMPSKGDREKTH